MHAAEIRRRFLDFFAKHGHVIRPSSSLVPVDDQTLLFTNAGMVQFKRVFLGMDSPPDNNRRATTSQKCVRAGGKHNDLEQVGHTDRHNTFFEMLGNFSFGDYFKRDAIKFAWEFITGPIDKGNLGIPKEHLFVSVFHEDDEARQLWKTEADVRDSRIYGLGASDNFWQMADTGPCGPCSEIYIDLYQVSKEYRFPKDASGEWAETNRTEFSTQAFIDGAEAGRFLEFWNLVFMQFDKQPDGTNIPLPKPSVDTGMGLERMTSIMQGVSNSFHTDLFAPYIAKVAEITGKPYVFENPECASYRVIADHARAVAFLLADGVFPSNEGRGYVLRRILRRAVRNAWILGLREPTLVKIVELVIANMRDVYPELHVRAKHIMETTRAEEERFLATIDGGIKLFNELAPLKTTQGSSGIRGTINGDDAFKLYDTFGFPIDLTELMARERGYVVDISGFETALDRQRKQSQEERKSKRISVVVDGLNDASLWETSQFAIAKQAFVGYEAIEIETHVAAARAIPGGDESHGARIAVILNETPFYAESGGQVSDTGTIAGDGWMMAVDDVKKVDGRIAAIGTVTGTLAMGKVTATVSPARRRDITRNHTATHLLHAALRRLLGDHVHQAGSVVEPGRLRFDFTHHGPLTKTELQNVERWVNAGIWQNNPVTTTEKPYAEAVGSGAMALFGEKYGDRVRVVEIPTRSQELCGGTHVSNTGQILLFRILSETGVSAGVRRVVALTGPNAFESLRVHEDALAEVGEKLKVNLHAAGTDALMRKIDSLLAEKKTLEKKLEEARKGFGAGAGTAGVATGGTDAAESVGAHKLLVQRVTADDLKHLQAMGDSVRENLTDGVGILAAELPEDKAAVVFVVGDVLRAKGVSAGDLVKGFAAKTGGRGGGKPHMAQMGVEPGKIDETISAAREFVTSALAAVS